jgi:hypothetical protein
VFDISIASLFFISLILSFWNIFILQDHLQIQPTENPFAMIIVRVP